MLVELNKLHRECFHPSPEKVFNHKKNPAQSMRFRRPSKRWRTLHPSQQPQTVPLRFQISFGAGSYCLNEWIIVDIIYLTGYPVLHIVNEGAQSSTAKYVSINQGDTHRKEILYSWAAIYTDMPYHILVDHGSFYGEPFAGLAHKSGIKIQCNGIERQSSLNISK